MKTELKIACVIAIMTIMSAPTIMAEQKLTVPEIVDVLVSLSDKQAWHVTGNCRRYGIQFKEAPRKNDGWVSVMRGFHLGGSPEYRHESQQITGTVLEYRFIANTCPLGKHQNDYDCFGEEVMEAEVVSKTRVKIRQKTIRQDPNGYIPMGERSCIFQKK